MKNYKILVLVDWNQIVWIIETSTNINKSFDLNPSLTKRRF
jgi:hypothetical protein